MKTFLSVLLIAVTTLFLVSCQREAEGVLLPNITTSDSVISKIIILDTSFASGSDTLQVIQISYDGNERLSRTFNVYYNTGVSGPGRIDVDEEMIYRYTGTQTLPFRVDGRYFEYSSTQTYLDTSYFTYTDGYISRDSMTSGFNDYAVASFQKLSNTRYRVQEKTPDISGGQHIDSGYVYVNWVNGNLVQEIDSTWLVVPGIWQVNSSSITYDTKPNPFKPLSVPYPAPLRYALPLLIYPELALPTTNNITGMTNTGFPPRTYSYEYGPTGLPRIRRSSADSEKGFFYYTNL